jgi:hypothetical protein
MLNSHYFSQIDSTVNGDDEYVSYRCKYDTIILYSGNGIPLAAVSFKCNNERINALLAPRTDKTHAGFQGIITEDDQEFQFIITNLTNIGMVKIDIMKSNVAVNEVDPGAAKGGVNKVNELHRLQSYLIRADQMNDSTMILSPIKKESGEKLTVGESEMVTPHEPKGTYYYIAVTPEADAPELESLFQTTQWVKDDIVCLKRAHNVMHLPELGDAVFLMGSNRHLAHDGPSEVQHDGPTEEPRSRGISYNLPHSFFSSNIRPSYNEKPLSYKTDLSVSRTEHQKKAQEKIYEEESVEYDGGCDLFCDDQLVWNFCDDQLVWNKMEGKPKIDDAVISSSIAASVKQGTRVYETSGFTGVTYKYDVSSNITGQLCCISLSICHDIEFMPIPDDSVFVERAKQMVQQYIDKQNDKYLTDMAKIYAQEDCVVCLENGVDTLFYDCGHACCHKKCVETIKKCPLCRRHINAVLKH